MKPRNSIEWSMVHWRIVAVVCLLFVAWGAYSLWGMPRQEFPQFTIRQGLVVAVMPGASSNEVEEQVAREVENYLFSFKEVDKRKTYSYSSEGRLVVYVELKETVKGLEAPAFWARLRHGLNELKAQRLPARVAALVAVDDFGDTSALLLALTAEGHGWRDMDLYMRRLEAELRKIPATSKLRRSGEQEESIRITLSRDRLARYGIRPLTVYQALQGSGLLPMAGRLDMDELEMPVHVSPVLHSEKEVGETVLLSAGDAVVRLRDVARVERSHGDNDAWVRHDGKRAMILSLEMTPGNDITRYGKDVDAAIARVKADLPAGVEIAKVADQPGAVSDSINHFLRDFLIAVVAVIGVTMLLLPLRVAAVAAFTIPVCVLVTVGILNILGVELQTVSLAGLVVVLGMVVDNAIIVIDNHLEKLEHGMHVWKAAWKSAHELVVPVVTATLAIVLCYLPLAYFMTGTAGDFVQSLPITIAVALVVSMVVAAYFVPTLNVLFVRHGISHGREEGRASGLERLQRLFDRSLDAAFRHPVATIGVGVASVAVAVGVFAVLPQQLFPKLERNQLAVEITLQEGRPLVMTDSVSASLERILRADRRVVSVTGFVGSSSPRFHTVYAPRTPSRSYAQLVVNTVSSEDAVAVAEEYSRTLRGSFPDAWVRWKLLEMQSFATPIEIRLWSDDLASLRRAAGQVRDSLRRMPVEWVRTDWEDPVRGVRLDMDWEEAGRLGISPSILGLSLASGTSGVAVGNVWEGDHPVKLVVREDSSRSRSLEGFRGQLVSSLPLGASVPLAQVAEAVPDWTDGAIAHRNGSRCLTVRVDPKAGVFAMDVQERIEEMLDRTRLPPGVSVTYGGETESSFETFVPMLVALGTSVLLIFLVLLCQFKRFRKAILVMLTMPLSLFGATAGLAATGYPFSLTAFIGVIGLMGIVVRNGIILVGYADELREAGIPLKDASIAAGKRRMRPIFLTSMAAAVGVVPMILSRSLLWGPLGAVTAFGLVLSMILTLYVLPVSYWLTSSRERPIAGIPEEARHA